MTSRCVGPAAVSPSSPLSLGHLFRKMCIQSFSICPFPHIDQPPFHKYRDIPGTHLHLRDGSNVCVCGYFPKVSARRSVLRWFRVACATAAPCRRHGAPPTANFGFYTCPCNPWRMEACVALENKSSIHLQLCGIFLVIISVKIQICPNSHVHILALRVQNTSA